MMARILLSLLLIAGCTHAFAQATADEERRIEAERRALEAERRAVDAEKRAVEAERRASQASQGSSQPSGRQQACQAATATYQFNCSRPSNDPLWETTQCADSRRLMLEKCG
ncbi:MAG TPA: hypothetical protein VHL85_00425 [Burkholderiales bacterium]|jgi:hypothetical protein|nr:hypothetical protein [Burkholderiales bacterium]